MTGNYSITIPTKANGFSSGEITSTVPSSTANNYNNITMFGMLHAMWFVVCGLREG